MATVAEVRLWGRRIGAVALGDGEDVAAFEYAPEFRTSGIELAPLVMPLAPTVYTFPALSRASFHGLPGLLADSLPDKFGHALIDAWLAAQGRRPDSFNAVERLCYVGVRGMGALEFHPVIGTRVQRSAPVEIEALVQLAARVLTRREDLSGTFADDARRGTLEDILRVGTSAGGARAKAVIAWNPVTNEVRSGQVPAPAGFGYWLLKFDGVSGNRDKELEDPAGYGALEFAYARMAVDAGVVMSECRLLIEGPRRHFMARRFDRLEDGGKLHMQSLGALAHYDFNQAGAHSYEQAFAVIKRLGLPPSAVEQLYRRMVFNVIGRNQDDHVKNVAFLMDKRGSWSLAPAYDMTFSYNPSGAWTSTHQMTINGKRDEFTMSDLQASAAVAGLRRGQVTRIFGEVAAVFARFDGYAEAAGVLFPLRERVRAGLRLVLPKD